MQVKGAARNGHDLRKLIDQLELEPLEDNLFRGQSRDFGTGRVFGGQVLGQALHAALRTVENRVAHSLHAYFLREGDNLAPIIYEVDRARDGRSFSNRRVVAVQHGRPIFNMAASFQTSQDGPAHQDPIPGTPPPEELKDLNDLTASEADWMPRRYFNLLKLSRALNFRPVDPQHTLGTGARHARQMLWMRTSARLPDDVAAHQAFLAFLSDMGLIGMVTFPHQRPPSGFLLASLDHACGSTARYGWTNGCCSTCTAPGPAAPAASRGPQSIGATACARPPWLRKGCSASAGPPPNRHANEPGNERAAHAF